MADLDLAKIAAMLGIAGSSAFEGERASAIRKADQALHAAGVSWLDLLTPYQELTTASQAASALLAENDALRAALAQAEANGAAAPWQDVSVPVGHHREGAKWVLDLHREGAVWLSHFEVDFLSRCTTWSGRLTPRMQPVYASIVTRVIERTGLRPPP